MRFEHLFVDIDDVLFDSTCWDRSLHKLLLQFGVVGNYLCHARVWNLDYLPAVYRGERDYWETLGTYLKSIGLSEGQATEIVACSRTKRQSIVQSKRVYPDARAGLFRLSSTMSVTLIANSLMSGSELAGYLRHRGLSETMFGFCTSQDFAHTLTDGSFWQQLMQQYQLAGRRQIALASSNSVALACAADSGVSPLAVGLPENSGFTDRFERFEQVAVRLYAGSQRLRAAA